MENGRATEVKGVNTGTWMQRMSQTEPMAVAEEEPVEVENEEEQKLLNARNPYDGTVYLDGKRYFWADIA